MLNVRPRGFLNRFVAILAGLAMVSWGTGSVDTKRLFYTNWFGDLVFAPIALAFGAFTIWCAIFKPEWLGGNNVLSTRNKD